MSKLAMLKPRVQAIAGTKVPGSTKRTGQGLYTYAWKQARLRFLRAHPLCECPDCDSGRKLVTPSQVVDHIVPHRGDLEKFWDESNWAALSKRCHDRKTAAEDGGFGNAPGKKARARKPTIGVDGWPIK